MREQSNISMTCVNDGGSGGGKLKIFTPHLWLNWHSVLPVFFSWIENRWLCHSVFINCWCLLSTEMIAIPFVLWEKHSNKAWIVVFLKGRLFFSSFYFEVIFLTRCVTYPHELSVPVTEGYVKRKRKETTHFVLHTPCGSVHISNVAWCK